MIQKLNITIELDDHETPAFEHWLNDQVNVLDFLVVPDTSDLYKNDPVFKKLSKCVKDAKKARDRYYNEKR
tara:strand:+ start:450 stop:662 length:213 start_codon:yes stop_codon:yes gene_type:complete